MGIGRITTFGALEYFKLMNATNIQMNLFAKEIYIYGTIQKTNTKVVLAILCINEELYEELVKKFVDHIAINEIIEYLKTTIGMKGNIKNEKYI